MHTYDRLYHGGRWQAPASDERLAVFSASTEDQIGSVPAGQPADVDQAVAAARAAFDDWSARPPADRAAWLLKLADALERRKHDLAEIISQEVGTPITLSLAIQVGAPLAVLRQSAKLLEEFSFEHTVGNTLVLREPAGVAGAITPWNYPLHQIVAKLAPSPSHTAASAPRRSRGSASNPMTAQPMPSASSRRTRCPS